MKNQNHINVEKLCYVCGKRISKKLSKSIDTGKYRGAAPSICNLKVNVPNEVPVVFHNGSNYDYDFIIKKLANQFERQFECLGENTENEKLFFITIEKEIIKIDKDGNKSVVTISYKTKFIDNT